MLCSCAFRRKSPVDILLTLFPFRHDGSDGDYFVKFTSNCDVPLLGDVDGNMNLQTGRPLPGHEAAMGCHATWKMARTVEDKSAVVVVPIISIAPSGCVNEAGGGCAANASAKLRMTLRRLWFGMSVLLSSLAPVFGEMSWCGATR